MIMQLSVINNIVAFDYVGLANSKYCYYSAKTTIDFLQCNDSTDKLHEPNK